MKKETFIATINLIKSFYDEVIEQDKKLEEAIGGDTRIMSDWHSKYMEDMLEILTKEMDDEGEMVDWLFWESMCSYSGPNSFEVEGVSYKGTPENVYDYLVNELKEENSIVETMIDSKKISNSIIKEITEEYTYYLKNYTYPKDEIILKKINQIIDKYEEVKTYKIYKEFENVVIILTFDDLEEKFIINKATYEDN
jgi:hypothetical protein